MKLAGASGRGSGTLSTCRISVTSIDNTSSSDNWWKEAGGLYDRNPDSRIGDEVLYQSDDGRGKGGGKGGKCQSRHRTTHVRRGIISTGLAQSVSSIATD